MSAAADISDEQAFNNARWGVKTLPSRNGGPDNELWVDINTNAFAGITAGGNQPNFEKFCQSLQRCRERAQATCANRTAYTYGNTTTTATPVAITGFKRPVAVMQQSSQSYIATQPVARVASVTQPATQPTAEQLAIQTAMMAIRHLETRVGVLERACHVVADNESTNYDQ